EPSTWHRRIVVVCSVREDFLISRSMQIWRKRSSIPTISTINAVQLRDELMQIHVTDSAVRLSLRAVMPSIGGLFPIAFFSPKCTLMPLMMAGCRNRPLQWGYCEKLNIKQQESQCKQYERRSGEEAERGA